jgi:TonB family protein
MFALIESCPEQRPSMGWTGKVVSLAIHAFVISAAVAASRAVVERHPTILNVDTTLVWNTPAPPRVPDGPVVTGQRLSQPILFPPAPLVIPVELPPPEPAANFNPGVSDPGPLVSPSPGPSMAPVGLPGAGTDAPRELRYVEELPQLLSHPPIRYPEVLRQAGIQGRVLIETVLDTLGRAEPAETRVLGSVNGLFDREALGVVLASRYRPARAQGRAVRVRVQIPVNFAIRP